MGATVRDVNRAAELQSLSGVGELLGNRVLI
jgi:hypothetical protein